MATLIAPFTPVDGNGHVRANAKLYLYQTGTSTPQNSFSDAALSVTNTNPVVADSNGLFPAIYLGDPPDFMAYKAILKTSADVTVYTVDPYAGAPIATPISASLLRGYIDGLERTSNTTTTLTESAGVCADDTNTSMLSLAAGTIDCATVGADGLDAGALSVTASYHRFAIGKTDGTVARLASTSVSSPTMPAGYTLKRRTGSFKTNVSAQIVDTLQDGDEFTLSVPGADVSANNPGTSAVTRTLASVPTGVRVQAIITAEFQTNADAGTAQGLISDLSITDSIPTTGLQNFGGSAAINTVNGLTNFVSPLRIFTNTSAQVRSRINNSTAASTVRIITFGWVDRRGRGA